MLLFYQGPLLWLRLRASNRQGYASHNGQRRQIIEFNGALAKEALGHNGVDGERPRTHQRHDRLLGDAQRNEVACTISISISISISSSISISIIISMISLSLLGDAERNEVACVRMRQAVLVLVFVFV